MKMDWSDITLALLELRRNFNIYYVTTDITITKASILAETYQLSWFDSLIVTAALETKNLILYSEDLNNKQIYENQLTVVNPFV